MSCPHMWIYICLFLAVLSPNIRSLVLSKTWTYVYNCRALLFMINAQRCLKSTLTFTSISETHYRTVYSLYLVMRKNILSGDVNTILTEAHLGNFIKKHSWRRIQAKTEDTKRIIKIQYSHNVEQYKTVKKPTLQVKPREG